MDEDYHKTIMLYNTDKRSALEYKLSEKILSWLAEVIQPHRLLYPGCKTKPALVHYKETGHKNGTAWPLSQIFYSGSTKDAIAPRSQEVT